MSWADERRANQAAAREQDRLDRAAAVAHRAEADALAAELAAARKADGDARRRDRRAEADRRRTARRVWRTDRRNAAARWAAEHVVEALCYPLGAASAVAAVPAMASFGEQIYGRVTGIVLPVLSELGAWCFAFAVLASRRRHPDRPVVMLTAGVAVFAGIGAALNFIHGIETGRGLIGAVVMAIVSVSGVAAHQLAVASPPRSRAERAEVRRHHAEQRTLARARRRAIRLAVVELTTDGAVSLLYPEGRWVLTRRRMVPLEDVLADDEPATSDDDVAATAPESDAAATGDEPATSAPKIATPRRRRQAKAAPRPKRGTGRHEVAKALSTIPADDARSKREIAAEIATATGLSAATVRTYLGELHAPSDDVAEANGAGVTS